MEYSCDRCGYSTEKVFSIKRHLTKAILCPPIQQDISREDIYNDMFPPKVETKYRCTHCNKSFANRHNKSRHMKQCANQITTMQARITSLEKQLEEVRASQPPQAVSTEPVSGPTITASTITNSFNTTNNIQINAFGKENINYLLESPEFEKYIVDIFKKKEHGLLQYVKDKYFHEDHPENHTIKKPTKNDKIVKCYNGSEWENNITGAISHNILRGIETDLNEFLKKIHNKEEIPPKYLKFYIPFNSEVCHPLQFNLLWHNNDDYEMTDYEAQEHAKIQKNIVNLLVMALYENTKLYKN